MVAQGVLAQNSESMQVVTANTLGMLGLWSHLSDRAFDLEGVSVVVQKMIASWH